MTEEPDLPPELRELEEQLRGVRAAPLREDFRERMRPAPSARRIRFALWLTAAAVLLVAATALWIMTRPGSKPDGIAHHRSGGGRVEPDMRMEIPPTWLAYTRAAAESPEELDRLLAAHDRRLLQSVPALEKNLPL